MNTKEKIELLEEIMDLEPGELDLGTILSELDEWDSMTKLSLAAEAQKEFGKTLSVEDIKGFITVQDICNAL